MRILLSFSCEGAGADNAIVQVRIMEPFKCGGAGAEFTFQICNRESVQ